MLDRGIRSHKKIWYGTVAFGSKLKQEEYKVRYRDTLDRQTWEKAVVGGWSFDGDRGGSIPRPSRTGFTLGRGEREWVSNIDQGIAVHAAPRTCVFSTSSGLRGSLIRPT